MNDVAQNLSVTYPRYNGESIANLTSSIAARFGAPSHYELLSCLDQDRLNLARRVVLLVIDGLGADWLAQRSGESILGALPRHEMTSVFPPTTATAVTTYLTGLAPQQHGLTGWFMHFRQLGAVLAVLPFTPRHGRQPLSAQGIEMNQILDCPSFADQLNVECATLLPSAICDSDFSHLVGGRSQRISYDSMSDFGTKFGQLIRGEPDVQYAHAYWSDFDHLSHLHGPSSEKVAAHFERLDQTLAQAISACEKHGTLLLITADHGFIDSPPERKIEFQQHPPLNDMLALPLCGEPRTAYCYVRGECMRDFEDYVTSELSNCVSLHPSEYALEEHWFGPGPAHRELRSRIGDFILQTKDNYTIGDTVTGERKFDLFGVHGGRSHAEMVVPLIVVGP